MVYHASASSGTLLPVPQVYRASGPKWRLVWGFTLLSEWQEYKNAYKGGWVGG